MNKAHVLLFGTVSVNLTLYSMLEPGYYIDLLISSDKSFVLIRILATVFMALYVFRPQIRTYFTRSIMRSLGLALMLLGVMTFLSPTFFGQFPTYIPIGDTLLFIEGGILATLLSLELSVQGSTPKGKYLQYLAVLLSAQPRKLLTAGKQN